MFVHKEIFHKNYKLNVYNVRWEKKFSVRTEGKRLRKGISPRTKASPKKPHSKKKWLRYKTTPTKYLISLPIN